VAQLSVVLGDYAHTRVVKDGTIPVEGVCCRIEEVGTMPNAFGPMVRELRWDVCEVAIGTLLQALEAGVPLIALPLAMNGDGHHRSLNRRPDRDPITPVQLPGRRVGVRAYSQTTGLWVRGLLREEHGIEAEQITWVTTEGPHVDSWSEPAWVQRAAGPVSRLMADDEVVAAAIGPRALAAEGIALTPVFDDPDAADEAWIARHGTIPVNHLVAVRADRAASAPERVTALYRALCAGIDATADQRDATAHGRAVRHGWTDDLREAIEIAGRYGVEQGLLRQPADAGALENATVPLAL
jgi:4,5-dihydroxyphthalate decarboxylase